ncbi:MAG TPA: hypothetical protein VFE38_09360 [Edaphobacter sp.]|nr:hypothetical protein [Edaphobacter sp.]
MTKTLSKHHIFLLLGAIGGVAALILNNGLAGHRLAIAQMILWTVLVFAFATIQVHKSLLRPRQLCVALALIGLHIFALVRARRYFPLNNMIVGFVGIAVEAIILTFLYARIGQSVDPKGPFGLTEAEMHVRKMKRIHSKL